MRSSSSPARNRRESSTAARVDVVDLLAEQLVEEGQVLPVRLLPRPDLPRHDRADVGRDQHLEALLAWHLRAQLAEQVLGDRVEQLRCRRACPASATDQLQQVPLRLADAAAERGQLVAAAHSVQVVVRLAGADDRPLDVAEGLPVANPVAVDAARRRPTRRRR